MAIIGCLTVAVVTLIGGSVLAYGLSRRIGPVESQVPANTAPILVLLEHPQDGASYPSDSQIGVQVRAVTNQPLASLQLWADGQLVQAENPTGATASQTVQDWVWVPGTPGDHTLVARALDLQGQIGTSNVVTLHIGDPATVDKYLQAQDGDTLASLAQDNNVSLSDAQAENPGVDPVAPLAPGQPVFLPAGAPSGAAQPTATPTAPATQAAPGGSAPGPNPILFWLQHHVSPPGQPASPPSAPNISLSVQGCSVSLAIADGSPDAVGLFVYRAQAGSQVFQRIHTLGPSLSQTYSDTGLPGPADYYVSAFNSAGESPSDIVHANVSESDCAPAPPAGVYLKAGILHLPEPVQVAYVYLSVNDGPWFRVPSDPHGFIQPDGTGGYPVGAYLPDGTDPGGWKTLSGHVWGWQGGQLVHVGDFDQSSAPTTVFGGGSSLITMPSKLAICSLNSCGGDLASYVEEAKTEELEPWSFQWTPQDSATTGGVYQVSDRPFVGSCSLDPSDLLMTGPVPGTPQSGLGQVFEIDLSKLDVPLQVQTPSASVGAMSPQDQGLNPTLSAGGAGGGQPQGPLAYADLSGLLGTTWVSPQASLHMLNTSGEQLSLPTYYFRVLPRVNNQIKCSPTNTVRLVKKPGSPPLTFPSPPNPEYQVTKIDFSEPWISSVTGYGCVKVIENNNPMLSFNKGDIICPPPYKGGNKPWYEQMFSFVVDAINWVSKAYQDAQNALVNLVADVIPGCNSSSWCKTALQAGLKAGLTALGLPPSIPNFDQLVELGKGSLTNAIADYATDATGVPCDNTEIPGTSTSCKGLIRKGIDAMVNEVKQAAASPTCGMSDEEAHAHGIDHGYCPLPGLKTQSVTSGLQPAQLQVTVERIAPDQQAGSCDLELSFHADNQQAVGDSITFPEFTGSLDITGPLHGDLFKPMYASIPDISVGQSTTLPFVLQANTSYLVPGYANALGQLGPSIDDYWTNWHELYLGAQLTIQAGGQYPSNKYYSDPSCVDGDQLQVGPLARPQVHAP